MLKELQKRGNFIGIKRGISSMPLPCLSYNIEGGDGGTICIGSFYVLGFMVIPSKNLKPIFQSPKGHSYTHGGGSEKFSEKNTQGERYGTQEKNYFAVNSKTTICKVNRI